MNHHLLRKGLCAAAAGAAALAAQTPVDPPPTWAVADDTTVSIAWDFNNGANPLPPSFQRVPSWYVFPPNSGFTRSASVVWLPTLAGHAGVLGFVVSVAVQLAPRGIRVNAIAPGMAWTPMVEDLGPEMRERRRRANPLGVEGTAWDVGWAAVYLASDEARWVTGQTLVVDGGVTLTSR